MILYDQYIYEMILYIFWAFSLQNTWHYSTDIWIVILGHPSNKLSHHSDTAKYTLLEARRGSRSRNPTQNYLD